MKFHKLETTPDIAKYQVTVPDMSLGGRVREVIGIITRYESYLWEYESTIPATTGNRFAHSGTASQRRIAADRLLEIWYDREKTLEN